jgi:D-3-phosphoglycerate dehydrogenase
MKRVLVTDKAHPILEEKLREAGFACDVKPNLTYDELLSEVNNYDALVVRSKVNIDKNFISQARTIKCIGRVGAGMETIDVDYAEQNGIVCLNSPEGNRDAVGEHTIGLLLALVNKMATANVEIRNGLWKREENRGIEIKGRTVGIIGFGNMGSSFAKRLQGFECDIISYDKYKTGYAPSYVEEIGLEELYSRADIVSFHIPLTDETHYMANESFFNSFAKPIYVLNTARGAVVKTVDLVEALKSGKVKGAALDVIEYEDMTKDGLDIESLTDDFRYLLSASNVLLTPHVGGWTVESKYKLAAVLADKIIDVLNRSL